MTKAAIVGWAHTEFGRLDEPDVEALFARVGQAALDHAGVAPADVDLAAVGVLNNGFSRQGFEAGLVSTAVPGLEHAPAIRLENACASGTAALYAAADFIESGRGRIALVLGAEKMTAKPTAEVGEILLSGCYRREEGDESAGFAGLFCRIAAQYFQRYGDHSAELAMIAAKNHANGVKNPYAHMRKDLGFTFCNTVSERNPLLGSGPLRRTDCSMVSDGAAAIVLADEETARTLRRGIVFRGRQQRNDVFPIGRRDVLAFDGARQAWARAFAESGLKLEDLSFVETHDCFTVAEMIEYEAMGLAAPGEGWKVVRDGTAHRDGKLPVNLSGGLKAKGHPIGATGVSMHVMSCMQLMGEAGEMQLPGVRLAGVFNMGGAAVSNFVSLLERVH